MRPSSVVPEVYCVLYFYNILFKKILMLFRMNYDVFQLMENIF